MTCRPTRPVTSHANPVPTITELALVTIAVCAILALIFGWG